MNARPKYLFTLVILFMGAIHLFAQQSGVGFITPSNRIINNSFRPIVPSAYYQEHILLDSTFIYTQTSELSGWELSQKVAFDYDNTGRLILRSFADREGSQWQGKEQYLYNYNEANAPVLTVKNRFNPLTRQWESDSRTHHYYNYSGIENEVLIEEWSVSKWRPFERIERGFDDDDNLTNELTFVWDTSNTDWSPRQRRIFVYDLENLLKNETIQSWDVTSNDWKNEEQEAFIYDGKNLLVESVLSTWDNEINGFQPQAVTIWDYNEDGNIQEIEQAALNETTLNDLFFQTADYNTSGKLDKLVSEIWNPLTETWEPHSYETHFWNKYLKGNRQSSSDGIECTFANPHSLGLPWHCDNLKKGVLYTIHVYDLYGRIFYVSSFTGGNAFRINKHIPSGMYIAVIQGGLDLHSEKVIIR